MYIYTFVLRIRIYIRDVKYIHNALCTRIHTHEAQNLDLCLSLTALSRFETMFASRGEVLRQQVMTRSKHMTQALDIQALINQAVQSALADLVPTNVGQTTEAPTTNVVELPPKPEGFVGIWDATSSKCGHCLKAHNGRHLVDCPNKPTNVGKVSAPPVVQSADVLSRRTFTLTKVKVSKNSEKWNFSDPEGKTWIDVTLPLGSGVGDVLSLAIS